MIQYKKGYKYQIVEPYYTQVDIIGFEALTDFISLNQTGLLNIAK